MNRERQKAEVCVCVWRENRLFLCLSLEILYSLSPTPHTPHTPPPQTQRAYYILGPYTNQALANPPL